MSDINEIIFTGRLGADPELKHTPDGTPTCTVPLAVERPKAPSAEKAEVDWFVLVFWDKSAESAAKYLAKGKPITARCTARTRRWKDKFDQPRKETEFRVLQFRMQDVPSKPSPGEEGGTRSVTDEVSNIAENFDEMQFPDGDLPF